MSGVVIAGTGLTPFGLFAEASCRSLANQAVAGALRDAACSPSDIGFIAYANSAAGVVTGQHSVRGQVALRHSGFHGTPIVNIENACASGSSAFRIAVSEVALGRCDIAIAIAAEKMSHPDRRLIMETMSSGTDLSEIEQMRERLGAAPDRTIFMDIYADLARKLMARSGIESIDIARVAAKNRFAGALNPKAQFRDQMTPDAVLGTRLIADPLTLAMCSPIGDGAAAIVVMSEREARKRGIQAVFVRACEMATGFADCAGETAARRAAQKAYSVSGIDPQDIEVAEVHDATASAEISLYADLQFCSDDELTGFVRDGHTAIGGRLPVNSSGGLLSRGHPIAATGCAQIVELADQLRDRCGARQRLGAKAAIAENGGGYIGNDAAVAVVTVLAR
jgi:acetyl-CoA acyltransferase